MKIRTDGGTDLLLTGLTEEIRALSCQVEEQAPMSRYTSFQIGGPADWLVTAPGAGAAEGVLSLCRQRGVPVLFLGNGTNMLVSDQGVRGVVLRLAGDGGIAMQGETIRCPAGLPLKRLCRFARDHGLTGLEFAYGIPGTVGGAVYMNAGAYGGQMDDVLLEAEALYPDGSLRTVPRQEMALGYRRSVFMGQEAVVVSAAVRLQPDDPAQINARMEEFLRRRREKQPLEYPSAGSFFKRPPGHYAGALIESSGLKGFAVGGAQVSEKHAGFVINRGGATCADVRSLAAQVQEKVYRDHGVQLEPEVRFIG
ncbi:MAG TPA: UDP-N-acetylmuramate dehydrogenase [Firmicutes bacterium]|nr:UDP-N-acetylmuramate dehydrogenase [Bacillota bacterium]